MADHSKPTLSSTYPNFLSEVKGRLEDISKQFDPAHGSASNVVSGTVRWSSSSRKWERWNGTAWSDLAAEYAINTSGSAAKLKSPRNVSVTGGATAAAVSFDGTADVTLNVTALNPAQLSAVVAVNKGGTGAATVEQARANLGLGTAATTNAADYAAKSHSHAWGEITGKPATFAPIIGGAANQAKAGNWNPSWGDVQGKPATFPPVIGGAANQAKAGNWMPTLDNVLPAYTAGTTYRLCKVAGVTKEQSDWDFFNIMVLRAGTRGRIRITMELQRGASDNEWSILRNGTRVYELNIGSSTSGAWSAWHTRTLDLDVSAFDTLVVRNRSKFGMVAGYKFIVSSGVASMPFAIEAHRYTSLVESN